MHPILADPSPAALTAAISANLFAYYDYLGGSPAAEFHTSPEGTWLFTGISHPFLNAVYRASAAPGRAGTLLERAMARARARDVAGLSWWTAAGVQDEPLDARLSAGGWTHTSGGGMAADLRAVPASLPAPAGLRIERVATPDALRRWSQAGVAGFGLPAGDAPICVDLYSGLGFDRPLRGYTGLLRGEPVATAQLFLAAGVAGIYWVATAPAARRQGIGAVLTLAALHDARALGYRVGILHATPLGEALYRRLGFLEYCRMAHHQWAEAAARE